MDRYEAALDEMEHTPDGDFMLVADHLAARKQRDEELRERLLSDETRRHVATVLAKAKDEGHFTIAQTEAALKALVDSIFEEADDE